MSDSKAGVKIMDNQREHYGWIELAALLSDARMVRAKFIQADDVEAIDRWRNQFKNKDIFSSICLYSQPDNESQFTSPMFFDIDCAENLPGTRESALYLCQVLMDRAFVPQDCLDIYFSGNKGFHVIVPCPVFDAFYTPQVLELYKKMAQKIQAEGIAFLDAGIYTKKRIWRLPNSINSKSGLFKIPLIYEELRDISMDGIIKLAQAPRPEDSSVIPRLCEKTAQWYRQAIKSVENKNVNRSPFGRINTKFKKGWRMPPCIKAIQNTVIPDGIRHQLYLNLARYYSYLNMHHDEILEHLEAIDQKNPIRDPDSIERTVAFGCEHPGFPGCDDPVLMRYCQKNKCFYAKLKGQNKNNPNE